MKKHYDALDFFKDKNGQWAIAQFPNLLIMTWLLLSFIILIISDDDLKRSLQLLNGSVLFAWAYLEITKGDSSFRRLLGSVVLSSVVYSYFM